MPRLFNKALTVQTSAALVISSRLEADDNVIKLVELPGADEIRVTHTNKSEGGSVTIKARIDGGDLDEYTAGELLFLSSVTELEITASGSAANVSIAGLAL